jgi:hypothetical protein
MYRNTKKSKIISDREYDAMEKGYSLKKNTTNNIVVNNNIVYYSKEIKPMPRKASFPFKSGLEFEINNV